MVGGLGDAFAGVALDTRTIPSERLNIDSKHRSNLFPWNGQFSPQLVEVLLSTYARSGSFILDPFLGSGTVLHEAGRLGHPAFGSEVNPAAIKMAEVYRYINVEPWRRKQPLDDAEGQVRDLLPVEPSLFSVGGQPDRPLQIALAEAANGADSAPVKRLLEALVVLLNFGDEPATRAGVLATWGRLRQAVVGLPFSGAPIDMANADARRLPIQDRRADIVVTSPPRATALREPGFLAVPGAGSRHPTRP